MFVFDLVTMDSNMLFHGYCSLEFLWAVIKGWWTASVQNVGQFCNHWFFDIVRLHTLKILTFKKQKRNSGPQYRISSCYLKFIILLTLQIMKMCIQEYVTYLNTEHYYILTHVLKVHEKILVYTWRQLILSDLLHNSSYLFYKIV